MKKLTIKLLILLLLCVTTGYTMYRKAYPSQKNYRFLLMCSSFKRPMFLSGQIFRLMNQTYQNFDISVSVKGVDPEKSWLTFEKEWRPYIKEKRLFLRYDVNKKQLFNLLDTIKNVDLSRYDYFCKIDDDDWYAPDYLETVNRKLNEANYNLRNNPDKKVHLTYTSDTLLLTEDLDTTYLRKNDTELTGPTLCFSRKILDVLIKTKENPTAYLKYLPDEPYGLDFRHEDRLIHHLGLAFGALPWHSSKPLVIYGQQYPSVTRNKNYSRYGF